MKQKKIKKQDKNILLNLKEQNELEIIFLKNQLEYYQMLLEQKKEIEPFFANYHVAWQEEIKKLEIKITETIDELEELYVKEKIYRKLLQ